MPVNESLLKLTFKLSIFWSNLEYLLVSLICKLESSPIAKTESEFEILTELTPNSTSEFDVDKETTSINLSNSNLPLPLLLVILVELSIIIS